jgi:hypothetical protein
LKINSAIQAKYMDLPRLVHDFSVSKKYKLAALTRPPDIGPPAGQLSERLFSFFLTAA